jgi:hypothetical protein
MKRGHFHDLVVLITGLTIEYHRQTVGPCSRYGHCDVQKNPLSFVIIPDYSAQIGNYLTELFWLPWFYFAVA